MAGTMASAAADALEVELEALTAAYVPVDAEEERHLTSLAEFIDRHAATHLFDRNLGPVHVTSTAVVLHLKADRAHHSY